MADEVNIENYLERFGIIQKHAAAAQKDVKRLQDAPNDQVRVACLCQLSVNLTEAVSQLGELITEMNNMMSKDNDL